MIYTILDEHGDNIIVAPIPPEGIIPRVLMTFVTDDNETQMVLTDRQVDEVKRALRRSVVESERIG